MTMNAAFLRGDQMVRERVANRNTGHWNIASFSPPWLQGSARGRFPPEHAPAAGRRSGRCQREPDLGPQPCTHLGDCCCDLRNMSRAQEEVVLSLGQRAELEIDAGGAGPLGELVGIVSEQLVLAVVDHRWRQPGRV